MESLSDTTWDVIISGTGLQQSLLALALSRSGKKVLHVDENDYYGGPEAAFSLQEAEEWVKHLEHAGDTSQFCKAKIWRKDEIAETDEGASKLSFSRAYTLTLSPQITYSRSKVLSQLVSSRVYKQLEFQAVGNWWIYQSDIANDEASATSKASSFRRLPNGREDIFSDTSIDVRAKRGLVKFLKFVVDYETQTDVWMPYAGASLPDFLSSQFKLAPELQTLVMALTLTLETPARTTVQYSLSRIARHLTSIGLLGPGFGAVLPKWGGGSEIAQVACRASAVGGAIYILGTGLRSITNSNNESVIVDLTNDEKLHTKLVVQARQNTTPSNEKTAISKTISIVDSDFNHLFTSSVEGAPLAAVSVVVFPSGSLSIGKCVMEEPTYIMVHSSETGECPLGQSILYASTLSSNHAQERLELATNALLSSGNPEKTSSVLYQLHYEQRFDEADAHEASGVYIMPRPSPDLAFDDKILEDVEAAWRKVMRVVADPDATTSSPYMTFQDREGMPEDNEDNE